MTRKTGLSELAKRNGCDTRRRRRGYTGRTGNYVATITRK
jgi:hypothetical protein